jgi:hypothetical protein
MSATARALTTTHSKEPLYVAAMEPELVNIPAILYATVDGTGAPAGAQFQQAVAALYSFSYVVKFSLKSEGVQWNVHPLEGLWWTNDQPFERDHPDCWRWRLMIAQPPQVSRERFDEIKGNIAAKEAASPRVSDLHLRRYTEGLAAQIMHVGPYETEQESIDELLNFIERHRLVPHGCHHEIYLNDPRRTKPQNVKTILRQAVTIPAGQGAHTGSCEELLG